MSLFVLWLVLAALFGVVAIDQLVRGVTLAKVALLKWQVWTARLIGLGAGLCFGFCLESSFNELITAATPVMIGSIPGNVVLGLLILALIIALSARRHLVIWRLDERAVAALAALHYREASALFSRLVARQPQQAVAWFGLSYALLALDQYVRALDACERALGLVSAPGQERASILTLRGITLAAMRRDAEALITLESALADAPRDAIAWSYKADVLARTGRYEEAMEAVAHAEDPHATRTSRSQHAWAAVAAAEALTALGRPQEALEAVERALTLTPVIYQARARRAQAACLSQLGQPEEAQQAAEQGLEAVERQVAQEPDNLSAWEVKADLLRLLGREAEADIAAARAQALVAGLSAVAP